MRSRIRRTAAVTIAALAAGVACAAGAADAPLASPAPAPALVVSEKAPPGCCCISQDVAAGVKPGCKYGMPEDKCRAAGSVLPKWGSTWTPGKCPPP